VRAVPHAGHDVPREPGLPQLQVPPPADAAGPRLAARARAQSALLQGLIEQSIWPTSSTLGFVHVHTYQVLLLLALARIKAVVMDVTSKLLNETGESPVVLAVSDRLVRGRFS
jgi:hypothetical protein